MAVPAMPPAGTLPLVQPPSFAQTPYELQSVLDTQNAEAKALRARLAESQRECAQLRLRLRDSTEEVVSAAETITSAAGRLEAHAGRQGLVLAAGVERCNAERAALEHELQRMERLLWERDQEIKDLQAHARTLEANRLHAELELTGLAVAHQTASSEVHALGVGVVEMQKTLDGMAAVASNAPPVGPSQKQVIRSQETMVALTSKQNEHAMLLRQAENAASESRRLEAESIAFEEHVRAFERELRAKQSHMELQDQKLIREVASLREQTEQLRFIHRGEQRIVVGVDQRAVLQDRCGEEAEGLRRELANTFAAVHGLVMSLRERGRVVRSPEVRTDFLDVHLHTYLRMSHNHALAPPVVWRIAHGQYLIGEDRVHLMEHHGPNGPILIVRTSDGVEQPLPDFVHQQAHRAAVSGRPLAA